jgi:hypothetical protein
LLRQRVPVVAFVNNHFAGFAPEIVQQLMALLTDAAPDNESRQERPPQVEQMARVLLEQAIDDGLVSLANAQWDDSDSHARTAEELASVAGILAR